VSTIEAALLDAVADVKRRLIDFSQLTALLHPADFDQLARGLGIARMIKVRVVPGIREGELTMHTSAGQVTVFARSIFRDRGTCRLSLFDAQERQLHCEFDLPTKVQEDEGMKAWVEGPGRSAQSFEQEFQAFVHDRVVEYKPSGGRSEGGP